MTREQELELALKEIVDAFYVEGKNPSYHRRMQQLLLTEWKTLWWAIMKANKVLSK